VQLAVELPALEGEERHRLPGLGAQLVQLLPQLLHLRPPAASGRVGTQSDSWLDRSARPRGGLGVRQLVRPLC